MLVEDELAAPFVPQKESSKFAFVHNRSQLSQNAVFCLANGFGRHAQGFRDFGRAVIFDCHSPERLPRFFVKVPADAGDGPLNESLSFGFELFVRDFVDRHPVPAES